MAYQTSSSNSDRDELNLFDIVTKRVKKSHFVSLLSSNPKLAIKHFKAKQFTPDFVDAIKKDLEESKGKSIRYIKIANPDNRPNFKSLKYKFLSIAQYNKIYVCLQDQIKLINFGYFVSIGLNLSMIFHTQILFNPVSLVCWIYTLLAVLLNLAHNFSGERIAIRHGHILKIHQYRSTPNNFMILYFDDEHFRGPEFVVATGFNVKQDGKILHDFDSNLIETIVYGIIG